MSFKINIKNAVVKVQSVCSCLKIFGRISFQTIIPASKLSEKVNPMELNFSHKQSPLGYHTIFVKFCRK